LNVLNSSEFVLSSQDQLVFVTTVEQVVNISSAVVVIDGISSNVNSFAHTRVLTLSLQSSFLHTVIVYYHIIFHLKETGFDDANTAALSTKDALIRSVSSGIFQIGFFNMAKWLNVTTMLDAQSFGNISVTSGITIIVNPTSPPSLQPPTISNNTLFNQDTANTTTPSIAIVAVVVSCISLFIVLAIYLRFKYRICRLLFLSFARFEESERVLQTIPSIELETIYVQDESSDGWH